MKRSGFPENAFGSVLRGRDSLFCCVFARVIAEDGVEDRFFLCRKTF